MKRLLNLFLLSCCLFTLVSCDMFKIDNYEAPNASIFGKMKDSVTGEAVETDIQNGTAIRAFELGWIENPTSRTWVVKQNGEYRNDMVFAGRYDLEIINGNVFPITGDNIIKDFEIRKGDNHYDFTVTPYIRIKNTNIQKNENVITATFNLEAGDSSVKLSSINLYAFTDIYVGEFVKFDLADPDKEPDASWIPSYSKTFDTSIDISSATTYTLTIDVSEYTKYFKYKRNYYLRVGALADVSGVGTIRYNYAPYVVINF